MTETLYFDLFVRPKSGLQIWVLCKSFGPE